MFLIAIHVFYSIFILFVNFVKTVFATLEWHSLIIHCLKIVRYSLTIDYKCFTYPFILLCKNYKYKPRNRKVYKMKIIILLLFFILLNFRWILKCNQLLQIQKSLFEEVKVVSQSVLCYLNK